MKGGLGDPFNQRVSDVCDVEVQNRADAYLQQKFLHNPIASWKKLEPETMDPILKRSFWSWTKCFLLRCKPYQCSSCRKCFWVHLIGAYKVMVSPFWNDGTKTWKCIFVAYFQNCPVISYGISDSMFSDINCSFLVLLRPQFVYRNWCYIPLVSWHAWKVLTSWTSNGEEMMIVRDESGVAEVSNGNPTWWHHPKKVVESLGPWGNILKSQSIVAVITIYRDGMKGFGQVGCLAKWVGPFSLVVEVVDFVQNWLLAELSQLECFWGPILWKSQGVDKSI